MKWSFVIVLTLLATGHAANQSQAGLITAILDTDFGSASAKLMATGQFDRVDRYFVRDSLPDLNSLKGYDSLLVYTSRAFNGTSPVALGNLLADYVDAGGHLVLANYAQSSTFAVQGRVRTPGYSPFVTTGATGAVSGDLVALDPNDPIFSGVDLNGLAYFRNHNFAQPTVADGASLLATDTAGVAMIARNQAGNVVAMNLFPGPLQAENNNELFKLVANALRPTAFATNMVPEPSSLALFSLGGLIVAANAARRRKLPSADHAKA